MPRSSRENNSHALHYRSCNLCEAICGIEIAVEAEGRLDIRGDKDDPFSRGFICPKSRVNTGGKDLSVGPELGG